MVTTFHGTEYRQENKPPKTMRRHNARFCILRSSPVARMGSILKMKGKGTKKKWKTGHDYRLAPQRQQVYNPVNVAVGGINCGTRNKDAEKEGQ